MKISVAAQNAAAAAVGTLTNGGTINIYTGAQPATPGTAASGTLLGTLTLSATAFGAASAGTITAAAITGDSVADASGTAGYFRVFGSTSVAVIDGTVSASGGGGELVLSSVSIVAGGTINVTSYTITMPGA